MVLQKTHSHIQRSKMMAAIFYVNNSTEDPRIWGLLLAPRYRGSSSGSTISIYTSSLINPEYLINLLTWKCEKTTWPNLSLGLYATRKTHEIVDEILYSNENNIVSISTLRAAVTRFG